MAQTATMMQRYKGAMTTAKSAVKAVAKGVKNYAMEMATSKNTMAAIDARQKAEDAVKEEQARNMRSRYYKVPVKK